MIFPQPPGASPPKNHPDTIFPAIAAKLTAGAATDVRYNAFMLKARVEGLDLTLFPDARAIITGTQSPEQARTIYARYIGA
jgi:molybdopterin-synthase adenylyltransferase